MLANDDKEEIVGSVLHLTITGLVAVFLIVRHTHTHTHKIKLRF